MMNFVNIQQQIDVAERHIEKVNFLIDKSTVFFEDIKKKLEEYGFENINAEVKSNNTGIRKTFRTYLWISAYKDDHKIELYNMEILTSCTGKKEPYKKACILKFGNSEYDHINIVVDGRSQCYDDDIGQKISDEYRKVGKLRLINSDYDEYNAALNFVLLPFKAFAQQNFDNDPAVGKGMISSLGRVKTGALYEFLNHTLTSLSNEIKKRDIAAAGKKFS